MGTRSITNIYDCDILLVTIYRQFDGYPTGQGQDIKDAFKGRTLVNGISGDAMQAINGMGCAAALLIAHMKRDGKAGGTYIVPPGTADEAYAYDLRGDSDEPDAGITLIVRDWDEEIYRGTLEAFDPASIENT